MDATAIIGLATLGIGLLTSLGGAIWWASAISTKMDALIALLAGVTRRIESMDIAISDLRTRVSVLEEEVESKA